MRLRDLRPGHLRSVAKTAWLFGRSRYCPICSGHSRKFVASGVLPRPDARCPWCDSLERHRLVWRYFQERTDLFDSKPKRMLHVAPEAHIRRQLAPLPGLDYLAADLNGMDATEAVDITDIRHPDDTFDAICCSHVLEHVPDDRRAMAELHRVLSPSGWAVLLVPITAAETVEACGAIDPETRLRLFGQEDHVRRYGPDFVDRLRDVGFDVKKFVAGDFLGREERVRIAVHTEAAGEIFHCTK